MMNESIMALTFEIFFRIGGEESMSVSNYIKERLKLSTLIVENTRKIPRGNIVYNLR